MKKAILIISGAFLFSNPLWATKLVDAHCRDFAKVRTGFTPQYLAVIDGYNKQGNLVTDEVDMAGIVSESNQVSQECLKNKTAKIDSIRKDLKTNTPDNTKLTNSATNTKPLNLTQAKCSDFISLDEHLQPVAAFWVAGHSKQGLKHSNQIDEVFLERPVAALVEECSAAPTASFYEKAKAWLKKEAKVIEKI